VNSYLLAVLAAAAGGLITWGVSRRELTRLRGLLAELSRRSSLGDAVLRELSHSMLIVDRAGNPIVVGESPTWFGDDLRSDLLPRVQQALADGLGRCLRFTHRQRSYTADLLPLSGFESDAVAVLARENLDVDESTAKLKRLAARNDAILKSAMDGFFIVDHDCRFLEVNDAFCRMTGYTEAELTQLRITDIELNPTADGSASMPVRTGLHQFPTAHKRKDGRTVYLENSVVVLHDDGRKILVGFARDVTDRKLQQEQIERLHAYNKLLLDSVGEGIFGLDRSGRLAFTNSAGIRMLGWTHSELIGRDLHSLLAGDGGQFDDCTDADCIVCGALRRGRGRSAVETALRVRGGATVPVEASIAPLHENGGAVGAVVVFQDITERKRIESERERLESQIRQAQKLESLGLLAGGIAHDFNNILVGILGNAFLALEQLPADSGAQSRIQKIISASQRASKMIQQIRAYSGRLNCEITEIDLNTLIDETIDLVRTGFPKSVCVAPELQPDLKPIPADGGQIQQVIMNLLINAAEALGERGGTITVRTRDAEFSPEQVRTEFAGQKLAAGRVVCLHVEDDGPGMTPEVLARVFDPFFSKKQLGRGLGLAAVRGIVQAHRGAIAIDSQAGRGTRITVVLPRDAETARRTVPTLPAESVTPGATVLVIDDEADIRDVVQTILERRGLHVHAAEDGASGLELLRQHRGQINVVLLDMNMPGLSGVDTYREITAIDSGARVIVSSGHGQKEALQGLQAGALFLQKPYTIQELMNCIGTALGSARPQPAANAAPLPDDPSADRESVPSRARTEAGNLNNAAR
jgi:PAS domain S-box-containing protein